MNVAKNNFNSQMQSNDLSSLGRIPPHSNDAEESVLGGILLDNYTINSALEILTPNDFYKKAHVKIFEAMINLTERSEPIDAITLSEELKKLGVLEECGGLEMISRLASCVPSSANVIYYSKTVKDFSLRRRAIHEASEIINSAFDNESETDDFIDKAEQRIMSISESRSQKSYYHVGDIVQDSIKLIEDLCDSKRAIPGISSGFTKLDNLTSGFKNGTLFIIAARPGQGKTALVLTIAQNVALRENVPVGIFSLEMPKEDLMLRMISSESRVSNEKISKGKVENDFPKIVDAASRLTEAPIYIDDTGYLTISELKAKARRMAREQHIGMLVVDYLQLITSPAYSNNREQEVANISRSLKALAKELNIPVIVLSQLNRQVEGRQDKRPMMSDLRDSGSIEQDADLIAFIYRDEYYHPDTTESKGIAEINIAKHRSGPTGMIKLAFSGEFTRFDNLDESGLADEYEAQEYNGGDASFESAETGYEDDSF